MPSISEAWRHAHSILHTSRQILNEGLAPLHLTSAEGNILLHLLIGTEGLRQDEFVSQLDVTKGAVSRALDTLTQKGFVTRAVDSVDRRVQRVYLTDAGHRAGPEVEKVYSGLHALALKGITNTELNQFMEVFQRMADDIVSASVAEERDDE